MDGFDALRASIAELSEVVDVVERISDTNAITLQEAAGLCQKLGTALAAVADAASSAAGAILDSTRVDSRSRRIICASTVG
jgi:methyl-accepting chemotaxis protein